MNRFLSTEQIPINSKWTSADGAGIEVKVINTDPDGEGWVTYQWESRGKTAVAEKSTFCFQTRYTPVQSDTDTLLAKLEALCLHPNAEPFWLQQAIKKINKTRKTKTCTYH
jgi:hypothetical protein